MEKQKTQRTLEERLESERGETVMKSHDILIIGEIISKTKRVDENKLGGKGASLERLSLYGFNIAPGIIIPTTEFDKFMKENKIDEKLYAILAKENNKINYKDTLDLVELIKSSKLSDDLLKEIHKSLTKLGIANSNLIVRSSANVEDSEKYSFAGQFDTVLDVKPSQLASAIKEVYSSIYNPRVLKYLEDAGLSIKNVKMAVVIQKFIETDFAGVAFTADPVTGDKNKLIIEYVKGLGEGLVSGTVEPTSISMIKGQSKMEIKKPATSSDELEVSKVQEVAQAALNIEKRYGAPMDIEWGIKDNKLFIFQARQITTGEEKKNIPNFTVTNKYSVLKGIPASVGIATGAVRIVKNIAQLKELKEGEILVCNITYDNYLPDMLKSSAIITQRGGLTSHAAIVAREHKIPCVVGVTSVMSILKDGDQVIVDASKGVIYSERKLENETIPEEAMDIILERLVPYKVSFAADESIILTKSTVAAQLEEPSIHVLLEEIGDYIIIHNPPVIKIDKKQVKQLESKYGKHVFIFGNDKYEAYTEVTFAMQNDSKFRQLVERLKESTKTGSSVEEFSKYCLEKDIMCLREAERILKKENITAIDACAALAHINDSAIYFTLVNTLLTTGYGVDYIRKQYSTIKDKLKIEFADLIIAIDEKKGEVKELRDRLKSDKKAVEIFDNIVDVYTSLAKWKFESDKLDKWERRKELWKLAAKEFKRTTGHDVKEFLAGQYGSGTKLVRFFKEVGYKGQNV